MSLNIRKVNLVMLNKGMQAKDLAEKMEVSKSRVSQLLNSKGVKNNNKTIISVAKALEVKPEEII